MAQLDLFGNEEHTPDARQAELFDNVQQRQITLPGLSDETNHYLAHGQLPLKYARLMVGLDANRQRVALKAYNSRRMTQHDFGQLCKRLLAEQDNEDAGPLL